MDPCENLTQTLTRLQIDLSLEDYQGCGMVPWFSFRTFVPTRPLPSISERPQMRTARLLVRPLALTDLDAFWKLRGSDSQVASRMRGRSDLDIDQSRQYLSHLNEDEQSHWYFGAFLLENGELIGEGGLPDVRDRNMSASGWPEGAKNCSLSVLSDLSSVHFGVRSQCCHCEAGLQHTYPPYYLGHLF